jgi:sarcosine oxidase subunit alpha
MTVPTDRRLQSGVTRPGPLAVLCDGVALDAYPGETLAAVMIAADLRRVRDDRSGAPRGMFCNMGTCSECFVWVRIDPRDTWRRRRACLTPVTPGIMLRTQEEPGDAD